MRVLVHALFGGWDAHLFEYVQGAGSRLGTVHGAVAQQGFHDLLAHGVGRVERGHGLLKHHGHAVAAQVLQAFFRGAHQLLAFKADGARAAEALAR